jgi:TatD DNase family protein
MHCHLDLMPAMQRIIKESLPEELGIIAVTTTPKAYKKEMEFCKENPNIKVALGLHPQLIAERYNEFDIFMNYIEEAKYIGEIGLDFNKQYYSSKEKQIDIFTNIIRLCSKFGDKVISIHSAKSVQYILDILEHYNITKNNYCILHWFTGTEKQLVKAIELGCYFSVNKKMLYTVSGKKIIEMIPESRVLVETDAPFIQEINHCKDIYEEVSQTIIKISTLRNKNMFAPIYNNSKFLLEQ